MANISRRNFMKVAAGAAGIAGLGLLNGCSKTEAPASSAAASAVPAAFHSIRASCSRLVGITPSGRWVSIQIWVPTA